jgi:hypothetical protein
MMASANLLEVLGTAPALGRWFADAENHRDRMDVAVVSDAFLRSRLGGSKDALAGYSP